MNNCTAFLKKECVEGIRAYKAIILLAVFLIFGILSPLIAKLMPELIGTLAGEGIAITVPEPTAVDSWVQFFKNITQMGLVVAVILFSGILSQETSKGALVILLTKGLSRTSVVLAKYSFVLLAWTLAYTLCALVCLGYTMYLFPENNAENLQFALFASWLFGVLLFSFLLFAATATKSTYACLLATGLFVAVLMLLEIVPATHSYNPLSLAGDSSALMTGATSPADLAEALIIALAASCACLAGAILFFRKRLL